MSSLRSNRRVLVLVEHHYEDLELWYPKLRLMEEGMEVVVAGPEKIVYPGKNGYPCKADRSLDEVRASDFDALVIPGGWAPDKLRRNSVVLELVREFDRDHKPIAMICHAGWVPISARILKGRKVTGVSAIKDDLENAGATFLDQSVVVDGHLISSRTPADLPDFCKALITALGAKVQV
ncbi:MAG: type 1 glutamine amidotransferase [Candidatus Eisenbacteria bacterium]|uniref:Type 1 glutamine amidotransferase n=1 Tax=Eiseniibacteriota bacterium TaxID=2212470 RepID=A0A538TYB7_UNCEI|nr:MAG: type 1 glutamine amidotransferase [Candidatus Eisenbacteria bacterium]